MKTSRSLGSNPVEAVVASVSVIFLLLILPQFGAPAMMIGSAVVLTALFGRAPDQFRSRHGSLVPAYFLIGAFWLLAAAFGILALVG